MPKNAQGQIFCLNGTNNPQHQMLNSNDSYALTKVTKNQDGTFFFMPDKGIPVKAYVCKECGYTEIYYNLELSPNFGNEG